jgi:hypothetical protein
MTRAVDVLIHAPKTFAVFGLFFDVIPLRAPLVADSAPRTFMLRGAFFNS